MIEPLVISSIMGHGFETIALLFIRVSTIIFLLPAIGERTVPANVKIVVAILFTLIIAPSAPLETSAPFLLGMAAEVAAGLMFGLPIRILLIVLQIAGSVIAQAVSLSQMLGAAVAEPVSALGHILTVAGIALLTIYGFHTKVALYILVGYELVGLGTFPTPAVFSEWGQIRISQAFKLAFSLSVPFAIVSVAYYFLLGVLNRAMPQLMVAFIGAPLIVGGGLIFFILAAPLILTTWLVVMEGFLANPTSGAR